MQRIFHFLSFLLFTSNLLLCPQLSIASSNQMIITTHPSFIPFVQKMVSQHQFSREPLIKLLTTAHINQDILNAIETPHEALPWYRYKNLFITKRHIEEGAHFWKKHQRDLERASTQYGVPPEIIVAILGIETRYGKNKGRHNVLDALTTLAFYYPSRAKFFRSELEHFLLLTREEDLNPKTLVGSYAGAMGAPQFIPSSYRQFAIDFNHNGKRDILHSITDSIGSIANYFSSHGWKKGDIIALPAKITSTKFQKITSHKYNPKPTMTYTEFMSFGVTMAPNLQTSSLAPNTQVSLLALEQPTDMEYWLGLHNFYVITRYNHSVHYAMAAYQLSEKIKICYNQKFHTSLKTAG